MKVVQKTTIPNETTLTLHYDHTELAPVLADLFHSDVIKKVTIERKDGIIVETYIDED